MVSHLKTQILNCFIYLMWSYFVTDSELSCLAKVAKSYLVCGPTYLPQTLNQLHCILNGAHEVLITIYWAKLLSVFTRKLFASFINH